MHLFGIMAYHFHKGLPAVPVGQTVVSPFTKEALLGALKVDKPPVVVIDSILPRGRSLPDRVLEIVENFARRYHCFVLGHLSGDYIYLDGKEGLSERAKLFKNDKSVTTFISFGGVTYTSSLTSDWGRIILKAGRVKRGSGLVVIKNQDERELHTVLDPSQRSRMSFAELKNESDSVLVISHKDAELPNGASMVLQVDAATVDAMKPVLEGMSEYVNWRSTPALPSVS